MRWRRIRVPPYAGHIFGKVLMTLGDRTFENDIANVSFTGKAFQNPDLFNGPWNDWPGAGYIPTAPYVTSATRPTSTTRSWPPPAAASTRCPRRPDLGSGRGPAGVLP